MSDQASRKGKEDDLSHPTSSTAGVSDGDVVEDATATMTDQGEVEEPERGEIGLGESTKSETLNEEDQNKSSVIQDDSLQNHDSVADNEKSASNEVTGLAESNEEEKPNEVIKNHDLSSQDSISKKGEEEQHIPAEQSAPRDEEAKLEKEQDVEPKEEGVAKVPSSTASLVDRDLPAPPTPSKEIKVLPEIKEPGEREAGDRAEMEEVAKAFGKGMSVSDEPRDKKRPTMELRESGQIPNLGTPISPDPSSASPRSPRAGGIRIGKGPPPTTQASEEKPFDFNRFLDQMRHKSAGPVGEYVRSFIKGFTKKPYRVSDQTKLIFDFLDFISQKMRECEVWAKLNTTEFENATEAMEKLLMNRLYNYTFSPAVKREGKWNVQTDDLERDRVLKQRIRLFGWISEEHLDVPIGGHSKGFVDFAIEELLKINHYKAPRDKVICILNCCKVIFGLIRHLSTEENADTFIPILIFVVLRSNPDNLISNVEYISRFRNPERLSSESGYYLSSLMGAIAFIETMDYTSLSNISQQKFEENVEAAVEKMSTQPESVDLSPARNTTSGGNSEKAESYTTSQTSSAMMSQASSYSGDEAARPLPLSAGAATLAEDTKAFFQRTGEAARAGIGASLGKPMGALGRLFQESLEGPRTPGGSSPAQISRRGTPESPPTTANSASTSARSRMWGLFGVDEDGNQRQQQSQSDRNPRSVSSSSVNFGSWSRSMQDEEGGSEPQTPISEELRQGRFATLGGGERSSSNTSQSLQSQLKAPRAQRQLKIPIPDRKGSVDPYNVQDDDGGLASGVQTPDDDGSDVELSSSPSHAVSSGRPRFSDLGGFLPSFLSEQSMNTSRSAHDQSLQQQQQQQGGELNDEEAAEATAQIEQAHLTAGVETLQSIFPSMEPSVCRLVLEDCHGDVQASIDKLLEMS